jgi:hypothetical protein
MADFEYFIILLLISWFTQYFKRWNEQSLSLLWYFPSVCIVELSKTMKNLQVFLLLQCFSWGIHACDMWQCVTEWSAPTFLIHCNDLILRSQNDQPWRWDYYTVSKHTVPLTQWPLLHTRRMETSVKNLYGWPLSGLRIKPEIFSTKQKYFKMFSVYFISTDLKSINMHHSSHKDGHWMWYELQTATLHPLELIWYLPC